MDQNGTIQNRMPCTPDQTRCRRTHLFPLLLLFIFLVIIYANSFNGTWVFDDEPNIVQNPYVHMQHLDWEGITGTFESISNKSFNRRPLAYLTFGLNYFFHGLDTRGYHLINLTVHCLSALFLYLFIFHTLHLPGLRDKYADRAGSIALLAAALWATSPVMVTSVTYIVQRMASMAGMFFIMAMFFYLMGRTTPGLWRKTAWLGSCLIAGFLSLASKQNAVMLPVVLYVFDILLIQGVSRDKLMRQLLPAGGVLIFLTAAAFILADPFNILSGYSNREFTLSERLLTQPRILVYYLSLMLYPMTDRLALIYEVQLSTSLFTPWTTIPAILFWVGWTGLSIWLARTKPLISFCLLFFVINHLIESTFIPLELIYEHRNYIPSMTIFLLISMAGIWFLRDFSQKRLLHVLTALVIVVTFFGQGHTVTQRNALFEHPLLLWADNAEKSPGLSRVHTNLGRSYQKQNLIDKAMESYLTSLETDRFHRHDLRAVPNNNLGIIYMQQGNFDKARHYFQKAVTINSGVAKYKLRLAEALTLLDELESAGSVIENLVEKAPDKKTYRALYSLILFKMNDYEMAAKEAAKAIEYNARPSMAHRILGESNAQLGEYALAQKYWKQYSEANIRDMEALLALIHLGHIQGDRRQIRSSAVRLLSIKEDRSWDELFEQFQERDATSMVVISINPWEILPLIRQGLELEIDSLLKEGMLHDDSR